MGWWATFLAKLASENKKELGTKRLDCCEVNQGQGSKPSDKLTTKTANHKSN